MYRHESEDCDVLLIAVIFLHFFLFLMLDGFKFYTLRISNS